MADGQRLHTGTKDVSWVGRWAIARKGHVLTPSQTQKADRHQVYHRGGTKKIMENLMVVN
jgi:hypothetical protein